MRYDPGSNLLVGQRSAEMLLDVGFQHRVEVLELSVSDQAYDVYLADSKEKNRDDHVLASAGQVDAKKSRSIQTVKMSHAAPTNASNTRMS